MKNNASLAYNVLLLISDMSALIAGFAAAFVIRAQSNVAVANPMPATEYMKIMIALLPIWIIIFFLLGLYHHSIYERRFAEAGRLLVGSFVGLLFIVFWDYMSLTIIFPAKLVPIYGFAAAFTLLVIFRNLLRLIRALLFETGYGLTRVIVMGNTAVAKEIIESLQNNKKSGYELAGVIGYRKSLPSSVPTYANIKEFISESPEEPHGIIQTELYANEARNDEILSYAQENHISYRFVPGNTELFFGNIDVELFRNNIPVIHVRHTPLFGWGSIVKRITDITIASLALILSMPIWLIIAALIKITDPSGPVFYRATRLSRYGTKIKVLKFRTMKQAYNNMSPEKGFEKMGRPDLLKKYRQNGDQLEHDPRVSSVGHFLKITSLDELPQLWNVIRGEISLVGPRALDSFEIEQYSKKHLILTVKSGLTGLALVSGRPGISFEERRKLDIYYVQNWSFWLDFIIMLKTVRVIFSRLFRKGARY